MTAPGSLNELPDDLPVPEDDGACDHLPGIELSDMTLPSTSGATVNLRGMTGRTVIYCYPRTGRPDRELPAAWDLIPGARGCTPQSCSFRDHYQELRALGARVYGVSTQSTSYQQEAAQRLHLPFELLSDEQLALARALRLPTFEFESEELIKRLTMIVHNGVIETVFYPVFPPNKDAERVIEWLSNHPAPDTGISA
jgi:peroxiredoxin